MIFELRKKCFYHFYRVQHRAVHGCQIFYQFGLIKFDVRYNCRARLSDDGFNAIVVHHIKIGFYRQFGSETDIKHGINSDFFKKCINFQKIIRKTCRHCG